LAPSPASTASAVTSTPNLKQDQIIQKINDLRKNGKDITTHASVDEIFIWIESKVDTFDDSVAKHYDGFNKNAEASITTSKAANE
jgi:hypothetical protein